MATQTQVYDCIVVGAGYAGLAAAKHLRDSATTSKISPKILVLEARPRVGGRVMTETYEDGTYFDFGGSYLGRGQPRMYALAEEYAVETYSRYFEGRLVQMYRGKHASYNGFVPALSILDLIDIHLAITRFEKLAKTIDLEEPWKTSGATRLDNLTLAEWFRQQCWTTAAKDFLTVMAELIWGARPSEFSTLHALWYSKAGISLNSLCTSKDGAQHELIVGGSQTIPNKIHAELGEESVHLGEPVMSVDHLGDDDGHANGCVKVTTAKNSYDARRVIIAIPPAYVSRMSFNPPLPHARQTLLQHSPMGCYWKFFACYETAFWRRKGLCGEATSPDGIISATFDTTPKHEKYAVLMAFVVGEKGRTLSTKGKSERERAILKDLINFFGKEAGEPFKFVEHTMMDEEFIGGCPVATPSPGMWTTLGPWLRKPFRRVHWAGTETSTSWSGYMEGAVCSGQRAAEEVLSSMKGT
ncbi:MAG: hypothetical protein M1820_005562 [Bogoriella megaspora]|nr:MAG: hypothetical protein M1820_005562 [Bogoriella megaspora]